MSHGRGRIAEAAPIDLREAMERLEGDRALLNELLELFAQDYPRQKAAIDNALKGGDAGALRRAAHSLKGAASNVSLARVRETASRLETAARDGRLDEARALASKLQSEYGRFEEYRAAGIGPPPAAATKTTSGTLRRLGKKRILIVDDDDGTCVLTAAWAWGAGWEADSARDRREALRRVAARAYDLIIVDLNLPDASGFEVSSGIRSLERRLGRSSARLVAWTASLDSAADERYRASDFSQCLEKPAGKAAVLGMLDPATEEDAPGASVPVDEGVRDLIPDYLKNRADDLRAMTQAVESGDFPFLEFVAHKIKGSAANFGFSVLGAICGELEAAAQAGNVEDVGLALGRFERFLAGILPCRE